MTMLAEPGRWLIQGIAWLPVALRPGVFLAVVALAVWLVAVQRALPSLGHRVCRGAALAVGGLVGLAILPEYKITTARHRHGQAPGALAQRLSPVADGVLETARSFYWHHERAPMRWRRPPWKTLAASIAVCGVAWVVMDQAPAASPVKQQLAQVFDVWRHVEAWADVAPQRRAAPGEPPLASVSSERRRGKMLRVTVRCPTDGTCHGWLTVETRSGRSLRSREITVAAGAVRRFHMHLPKRSPRSLRVEILRASPP
jgi:hypothetical protein